MDLSDFYMEGRRFATGGKGGLQPGAVANFKTSMLKINELDF